MKTPGFNKKNKSKIEYPNLLSAIRPMPHSADIPVPVFEQLPYLEDLSDDEECVTAMMQISKFTRIQFIGDLINTS